MKGLLKGLRYISQIFDAKEEEMQIGYPTDVKHVAHIGWDGPSVNPPTWMNEFRSAPLSALGAEALADQSQAGLQSSGDHTNRSALETPQQSPLRELPDQQVPKPRRQSSASGAINAADSTTQSPGVPRHSRRNKSATSMPIDNSAVSAPTDSPARDMPSIPKVARKKKTKAGGGAAVGGSSRSGRPTKAQAPWSDGGEAVDGNGENAPAIRPSADRPGSEV